MSNNWYNTSECSWPAIPLGHKKKKGWKALMKKEMVWVALALSFVVVVIIGALFYYDPLTPKHLTTQQLNDGIFGVPRAAGTEMAPKSKWGAVPTTAKSPAGVVLDFATLTDNGTTAYKIVENEFMPASEGTLFSEPYDAKSGSLGFGIVERTRDGRFFPCVMNVSARGTGTMRWFSQSGNGNPSNICLFTPNN